MTFITSGDGIFTAGSRLITPQTLSPPLAEVIKYTLVSYVCKCKHIIDLYQLLFIWYREGGSTIWSESMPKYGNSPWLPKKGRNLIPQLLTLAKWTFGRTQLSWWNKCAKRVWKY